MSRRTYNIFVACVIIVMFIGFIFNEFAFGP